MMKKLFIFILTIISAVCLAAGISACGSSENSTVCSHEYGDWITGEQATCTSMGYEYRVCSLCNDIDYRFAEASGHTYSSEIINYDYNTHMLQCTTCNQIITEAHTYVDNICSVCGCHYYSEGLEFSVCSDSEGNVSYAVSKGTCTDSEITIPSIYKGYPVTQIPNSAFSGCTFITSVTIPDSVTSIGNSAFYGCTMLENIIIPDSVISIGSYAFYNCMSLKNITLPNNIESVGIRTFSGCSSLQSITIPDSATSIGTYTFENCSVLTYVFIGSNITSIETYAFSVCSSLKSVIFDEDIKLEYIGSYAFSNCSSLESITIPDGVTEINTGTFIGCTALTNITIPDSVTYIGDEAFSNCTSLESILIGSGLKAIYGYAFYNCSSLKSIVIPNSVTYILEAAFGGCSSLESMTIPFVGFSINSTTASEYTLFGYIFGTSEYEGGTLTSQYCENYTQNNGFIEYYIPATLTTVTITGGTIFSDAFFNCQNLTNVIIGDGVTMIGPDAFFNCSSLSSITIGDGVTIISYEAFYNCSSLANVTIGNGVTYIGRVAFCECTSLESVYYNGTADDWDAITFIGNYSYPTYYGATIYYYSEETPAESGNYWYYNENDEIVIW